MKAAYIEAIDRLLAESNNIELIDFIYQLLEKRRGK